MKTKPMTFLKLTVNVVSGITKIPIGPYYVPWLQAYLLEGQYSVELFFGKDIKFQILGVNSNL